MSVNELNIDPISRLILSEEPFCVSRPGIGGDGIIPYLALNNMQISSYLLHTLIYNAGIYFRTDDLSHPLDYDDLLTFCKYQIECYKISNSCACFFDQPVMKNIYHFIQSACKTELIDYKFIEPYYLKKPWTKLLEGKKILVVSPFADTIQKQYQKRELLFENKDILPEFNLICYKSPMTLAGNKLHSSWKETFDIMWNDIKQLDFDVALLGCGGYGHPLCLHIRKELNKSCIYIGGALQILFGIMGKRWETMPIMQRLRNQHWCYPSEEETCANNTMVEGGGYWK